MKVSTRKKEKGLKKEYIRTKRVLRDAFNEVEEKTKKIEKKEEDRPSNIFSYKPQAY